MKSEQNTLEKGPTLEQKRDQLIEKADKLHQEKMEMIADNLKAEDPILRAKQEEIDNNFEEIEAVRAQIESTELSEEKLPDVITAESMKREFEKSAPAKGGERVDDIGRGIKVQYERSKKEVETFDATIADTEKKIEDKNISDEERKGLQAVLNILKNDKRINNMREGNKLEAERMKNVQENLAEAA